MFNPFQAKILLFGEYGVLQGSEALSIPHSSLQGRLCLGASTESANKSHQKLLEFYDWLGKEMPERFDVELMRQNLNEGLYFRSNIPMEYGVGSSAALVAATVDAFAKAIPDNTTGLRTFLAEIEGYFHGKSSGLDALVSYLGRAIHQESDGTLKPVNPEVPKGLSYRLIDSGMIGPTSGLVARFRNFLADHDWSERFTAGFVKPVNKAIQNYLAGNAEECLQEISRISEFSLTDMNYAFPEHMADLGKQLIKDELGYLKLCGSGGGGFFLLFHPDDVRDRERDKLIEKHLTNTPS